MADVPDLYGGVAVHFDPTINVSALLGLVGTLGTIIFFGVKLTADLHEMRFKLDLIWSWFLKEHHANGGDRYVPPTMPPPEARC